MSYLMAGVFLLVFVLGAANMPKGLQWFYATVTLTALYTLFLNLVQSL